VNKIIIIQACSQDFSERAQLDSVGNHCSEGLGAQPPDADTALILDSSNWLKLEGIAMYNNISVIKI